MKRALALLVAAACSWIASDCFADSDPSSALQAGTAVIDITPPVPYRMSGYFSERLSTGIKQPLEAKAVVFHQGAEKGALVFCDLIGLPSVISRIARKAAAKETGIPESNISITATHSHTGPLYYGALREHFHRQTVAKHGKDIHETVDYPAELAQKLAAVIVSAQENLTEVELAAGVAEETRLSFNRRFHMKDGSVRFNPGQQNPNIVRAAGPIDPQVGIIAMRQQKQQGFFAAIISFALHLDTVGGTEYSTDYPGFLQSELRRHYGPGFLSLFGAGTCGDINHVDVRIKGRRSAEEIGTILAESTHSGMKNLTEITDPSLAVASATLTFPLQQFSETEVEEAQRNMDLVASRSLPFLERVKAYKIVALQLRNSKQLAIEVHAFRFSKDVALVTLPGEVFVELGLAIKQASPFKTTLVVELANDAPGYLPTRKAFVEGSYETVNSRIQSGGGEAMVELAVRLLEKLAER